MDCRWAGLLLSISLGTTGCVALRVEDPSVSKRLIDSKTSEQVIAGIEYPLATAAQSGLSREGDVLSLNLVVSRAARCQTTRTDTWETRTTTVRTSNAGVFLVAGALLTSVFAAGVVRSAQGEPFSRDDGDGQGHLTAAGTELVLGALGLPILVSGVIGGVRSIDGVDTRRSQQMTRRAQPCYAEPLGGEQVTLSADGAPVSTRRSGPDGRVAFELNRAELVRHALDTGLIAP